MLRTRPADQGVIHPVAERERGGQAGAACRRYMPGSRAGGGSIAGTERRMRKMEGEKDERTREDS